jgi:Ca-activated chloride channel homolog
MFDDITFSYPWVFYFLLLIPLLLAYYWRRGKKLQPSIVYSALDVFKDFPSTWKEKLRHLPVILRMLAFAALIIALARPQTFSSGENIYTEGIDIALVFDISGSMLAEDLKPSRVEAAKGITDEFISARTSDRIGLVVFAREAFTQCPLTVDYSVLRGLLKEVKPGMIEDGTAIGNAIANGVNRLKDSDSKSKIIILLTDGVNNAGEIDPISAAQIAKTFGVRIYTVGVGTRGEAPYPVQTPFGTRYQMVPVEIDEKVLQEISNSTNGMYFRATDNQKLKEIYNEIDQLEKTKVEVTSYRKSTELFYGWLGGGFLLLILEFSLLRFFLRKLP